MSRSSPLCFAFSVISAALLTGCGAVQIQHTTISPTSTTTTTPTPSSTPGSPIVGNVHGGQPPVAGAHIYLFAASQAGYGAPSISLLNGSQPGVASDSVGSYVLTDANGYFTISGDYTCTTGQQVYVLALGGNPGLPAGEVNPALNLMAAVGACPTGQSDFSGTVPFIYINEVSTVAAVYALSGFMTDATHISSPPTANALQGLANAFRTVPNLVDLGTGVARLQSIQANGDVPQAEINSLANLLVTCVNSDGGAGCDPLFTNTPSLGGISPSDTISAALNIARNPAANVPALYTASKTSAPFQPALTAAPNDWTIALTFYSSTMVAPYFPAIDSIGNVWVPGYTSNNLTEFDPTGSILSGAPGFTGGGLNLPYSIAIDSSDNPWIINFGPVNAATVSRFNTVGASLTGSPYACADLCFFPAFDASQNLWISGSDYLTVLRPDGSVAKKFTTAGYDSGIAINRNGIAWTIGAPRTLYHLGLSATLATTAELTTASSGTDLTSVAIDSSDNVWYASSKNNALGVSDKNGVLVSPANGYTGGGLKGPAQIAIDGSNRIWIANRDGNSLSAFTNTGAPITPTTGYQAAGLNGPRGLAIDPSGNIWLTNFTYNSITEFVGVATPATTPISATTHGQRP